MNTISECDLHYLAGLVDGEGTVSLIKLNKRSHGKSPVVYISSNDLELLEWVKDVTGIGRIATKPPRKPTHNTSYTWMIDYNNAIGFLELIAPLLKINKKRLRALLIVDNYRSVTKRNGYYNEEERLQKDKFESDFFDIR